MVLNPMTRHTQLHLSLASLVLALGPAAASAAVPATPAATGGGLVAIRVGRAETVSQGAIEHAVILVGDGKILALGEDLPVERGVRVLDRPGWTAMPGLVNCYSRAGMDGEAGSGFSPSAEALAELYPRQDVYRDLLELGVTTMGLYPAGTGVPGMAVAIRPRGATTDAMVLSPHVYLKAFLESDPSSKKTLRKGFESVDEYEEKVEKARQKWEKDQEKKAKKKKKPKKEDEKEEDKSPGDEDDKDDGGEAGEGGDTFVPPAPDPDIVPFVELRAGRLPALFRLQKASDYLHLLDVIEDEEEMVWHLRVPLRNDVDLFHVADKIGERELTVVLDPRKTFQPNSMRYRNIPAEIAAAGGHVALIPLSDDVEGHREWLSEVGSLIPSGLEREDALASVTLAPSRVLGLEERLGSLDVGKDANLVFFDGDPFEPSTRVQAVLLEGEFVFERSDQ